MTSNAQPKYRRILLKLSGEFLKGDNDFGIDADVVARLSREVVEIADLDVEVGIVIGGGNIFRGAGAMNIDRAAGDYIGMMATLINSLTLQAAIEHEGRQTRVMSAIEVRAVAETYIRRRAVRHLERGRVVIFGCGTGNPYFTTDTAAALRANEIEAEVLLKATQVDAVYSADPKKEPDAKKLDNISYQEVLSQNLGVMDASAISLCRENSMPILVFNLNKPGNILRAVMGEQIGTIIDS